MATYWEGATDAEMLEAFRDQYLTLTGWLRSVAQREIVDLDGPVPWFTYPASRFLARIVRQDWKVFEYGAGASSVWWAARVDEVASVEHNVEWVERVRAMAPSATIATAPEGAPVLAEGADDIGAFFDLGLHEILTQDEGHNQRSGLHWRPFAGYASQIAAYPKGSFDVIVVDGMARSLTAWMASRWLKPEGLIVFDNSDRDTYKPGYELLLKAGFVRIDFWGPGPLNPYEWCTSIFVRSLKALDW